ncbi:unnamed protein product [Prorocentrum cordatum]|uniref:B9 domain-containing protein 2 n=1 Tax=Prorocentrum cordatum TaxID=2364126 RepID=A0ABN9QL18_9DINO|nr:unnamed protein product [Polarella glacialis]
MDAREVAVGQPPAPPATDARVVAVGQGAGQPRASLELAAQDAKTRALLSEPEEGAQGAPGPPPDSHFEVHYVGELEFGARFPGAASDDGLFVDYAAHVGSEWHPAQEGGYAGQTQTAYPDVDGNYVFNHPIDFHYFAFSLDGWPAFHVEVLKLDPAGQVTTVSYGSVASGRVAARRGAGGAPGGVRGGAARGPGRAPRGAVARGASPHGYQDLRHRAALDGHNIPERRETRHRRDPRWALIARRWPSSSGPDAPSSWRAPELVGQMENVVELQLFRIACFMVAEGARLRTR